MTDRTQQPAQLKRQVERLTRLLAAEKERSRKLFEAYGNVLAEKVDVSMKLQEVRRVIDGEIA